MSAADRAAFFRQLGQLLGAGITVTRAGELMGQSWRHPGVQSAMSALRAGLERGESIAGALQPALTAMEHGVVTAAEKGGRLDAGMKQLAQYYDVLAAALTRVKSGMAYPILIAHVAVVIPAIVLAVMRDKPVWPAVGIGLLVLWLVLAGLWYGARAMVRAASHSPAVDAVLGGLPVAGTVLKKFALARWCAVLHFHLVSAQRMSDALHAAGAASASARLHAASHRMAAAAEQGNALTMAMGHEAAFPPEFAASLAAAEEVGALDEETERQTTRLMEEAAFSMSVLAEWLPRIIYIVAMVFAAVQIFRMAAAYGKGLSEFMQNL